MYSVYAVKWSLQNQRYKQWCCSLIPAESNSLPHTHAQTTMTYYKHQDSRIKKAQELKTKTFANFDIKDPSSETKLWGRLLKSFQEDAKYEHVGQDTRSQDGKDDQDIQGKDLKISELKTMTKVQDQRSHSMKEQAYNKEKSKNKTQILNDKSISKTSHRGRFTSLTINPILEDKVLIKLDFSKDHHIKPNPNTIISADGNNIISNHKSLMEKFKALVTRIDTEFLNIRGELKEIRDGHIDEGGGQASQIYMSDNTPMCDPMEANYVKQEAYHGGYHDQNSRNLFSYPNHNPNRNHPNFHPRNKMPHLSQYYEIPETSMEKMILEWMAILIEANENLKNQVVELEHQINQGIRNHQAIIKDMETRTKN
ncbi:hypothetical protein Tco_0386315 [Tanacetum coccineum]